MDEDFIFYEKFWIFLLKELKIIQSEIFEFEKNCEKLKIHQIYSKTLEKNSIN